MELELIQLTPEDIQPEWTQWFESDHTKTYTRSGRRIQLEELRASVQKGIETKSMFTYGVRNCATSEVFGTVKIGPIDRHHGLADLAVLIGDTRYLGLGLGKKLVKMGSELAFRTFPIRKLHSGILQENIPSIKAYISAGWLIEGVLPKHYINQGVAQDWYLISKYNPNYFHTGYPKEHAVDPKDIFLK